LSFDIYTIPLASFGIGYINSYYSCKIVGAKYFLIKRDRDHLASCYFLCERALATEGSCD
jgi:hypothetical protein